MEPQPKDTAYQYTLLPDIFKLSIKANCTISLIWRVDDQSVQSKNKKEFAAGVANFNDQMQLTCRVIYDPAKKQFAPKKASITVCIHSDKQMKQAGEVEVDLADILNKKLPQEKYSMGLKKCPDPNALLSFRLRAKPRQSSNKQSQELLAMINSSAPKAPPISKNKSIEKLSDRPQQSKNSDLLGPSSPLKKMMSLNIAPSRPEQKPTFTPSFQVKPAQNASTLFSSQKQDSKNMTTPPLLKKFDSVESKRQNTQTTKSQPYFSQVSKSSALSPRFNIKPSTEQSTALQSDNKRLKEQLRLLKKQNQQIRTTVTQNQTNSKIFKQQYQRMKSQLEQIKQLNKQWKQLDPINKQLQTEVLKGRMKLATIFNKATQIGGSTLTDSLQTAGGFAEQSSP